MTKRIVSLLKDETYQLLEIRDDPYDVLVIHQGTLPEIEAYISLEEKGLI